MDLESLFGYHLDDERSTSLGNHSPDSADVFDCCSMRSHTCCGETGHCFGQAVRSFLPNVDYQALPSVAFVARHMLTSLCLEHTCTFSEPPPSQQIHLLLTLIPSHKQACATRRAKSRHGFIRPNAKLVRHRDQSTATSALSKGFSHRINQARCPS